LIRPWSPITPARLPFAHSIEKELREGKEMTVVRKDHGQIDIEDGFGQKKILSCGST
jgi:hypothetical protein